ncbi:helix-turn-helix domain-containing protein [Nocardia stercoris]|uniref:Helix-turn-helix domain-containing protein n=1 Tax=Nocardia stercoris TaxID=2483361 RepID=A0A3M2KVB6_9NOCA|nr:helix-turn-helix domain-containing protein [Nocardia stercoris]RMI28163.1 helix-turn-helix domain-containing protein [Nocardia stercoris]
MSRDIGNTHRTENGCQACRPPAWSSPPSSSNTAPRPRSPAPTCISPGWVSKLVARYHAEDDTALEPRSRRPHTSPNATPPHVVDLIIGLRRDLAARGLDAGPHTIAWHLRHHHGHTVSPATISRT